nr:DUF6647 family protein [Nitratireductor luteus]
MNVIALWLSVTLGLPEAAELPEVRYAAPRQMAAIRYGQPGVGMDDIVAIYSEPTQTIYLRHDWNSRNIADISVLVHELVHHLQNKPGTVYSCPQEREALAYEAQERWLQLFGSDLESSFGIDAFSLKVLTHCVPH